MDFIVVQEIPNQLKLYDYTVKGTIKENYTSYKCVVESTKMSTSKTLDIINYLYEDRVLDELYTINPTTLGFNNNIIPDGIYKFTVTITTPSETNYTKTRYTILYHNIQEQLETILEKYNYSFDVSESGTISYVKDSVDTNSEQIRLLSGLVDQLKNYTFATYSSEVATQIDNIIQKATRIAQVLI